MTLTYTRTGLPDTAHGIPVPFGWQTVWAMGREDRVMRLVPFIPAAAAEFDRTKWQFTLDRTDTVWSIAKRMADDAECNPVRLEEAA